MKAIALVIFVVLLLAGGVQAPLGAASSEIFSGEVWTWDQVAGTVTLRQLDGRILRVKVPPETFGTLRLHQVVTLRGELAPPKEIEHIQKPAGPMTPVPHGEPARSELEGTIAGLEPGGSASIASPQGLLRVPVAAPPSGHFQRGSRVRVRTSVQAVRMVPGNGRGGSGSPLAVGREPGDYAVVVGRITAVDRDGRITLESPRGAVTVWVPAGGRHAVGDTVEVRTSVHPTG